MRISAFAPDAGISWDSNVCRRENDDEWLSDGRAVRLVGGLFPAIRAGAQGYLLKDISRS